MLGFQTSVYIEKPKSKAHARALLRIHLGNDDHGTYKIEIISTNRRVYSLHVTFEKSVFPVLENDDAETSDLEENTNFQRTTASARILIPQRLTQILTPKFLLTSIWRILIVEDFARPLSHTYFKKHWALQNLWALRHERNTHYLRKFYKWSAYC